MSDTAAQATFRPDLLAGKAAFISGGTSGINLGIAKRFAGLGARVAVLGRNPDKANAAAAEIDRETGTTGALAVTADVRDYAAVEEALKVAAVDLGKFDILIVGQAGNFVAPALGMSANAFKAVVDIDLIGSFNLFRAGHRRLNEGASLIAITAGQAVKPSALQAHVCAAKAGVNMLVKCLALEWVPMGIRVNAISPGPIEGTEGMARLASTPEAEAAVKEAAPLRRYGRKDEIGDAAVYLCSPAGQYVTGTVLDVDGGTGLLGSRGTWAEAGRNDGGGTALSTHHAVVEWVLRPGDDFAAGRYSRAHTIGFDRGVALPGSASPSVVRAPWSEEAAADPEEMLVAAISACHMLWFLDFAKRAGLTVARYRDAPTGRMGRMASGKIGLAVCTLRPAVQATALDGGPVPPERLAALHHDAHAACNVSNSVLTEVRVQPA